MKYWWVLFLLLAPGLCVQQVMVNVTVPLSLKEEPFSEAEIMTSRSIIVSAVSDYFDSLGQGDDVVYSELYDSVNSSTSRFFVFRPELDVVSGEREIIGLRNSLSVGSDYEVVLDEVFSVPVLGDFYEEVAPLVDYYDASMRTVPEPFRTIFGSERMNVNIILADGTEMVVGVVSRSGKIVSYHKGALENPTLTIRTYENTIRRLANSQDQVIDANQAIKEELLSFEGGDVLSSIKYAAANMVSDLSGGSEEEVDVEEEVETQEGPGSVSEEPAGGEEVVEADEDGLQSEDELSEEVVVSEDGLGEDLIAGGVSENESILVDENESSLVDEGVSGVNVSVDEVPEPVLSESERGIVRRDLAEVRAAVSDFRSVGIDPVGIEGLISDIDLSSIESEAELKQAYIRLAEAEEQVEWIRETEFRSRGNFYRAGIGVFSAFLGLVVLGSVFLKKDIT